MTQSRMQDALNRFNDGNDVLNNPKKVVEAKVENVGEQSTEPTGFATQGDPGSNIPIEREKLKPPIKVEEE